MKTPLTLEEIFTRLFDRFGPLNWWPAETPFEVCVGAILTQNTAWSNVEKAIHALKQEGGTYGLATMCIGGGQGIATIVKV